MNSCAEIKSKRGRPPKIDTELYAYIKLLNPEIKTRRGIMNKYYELQAFRVVRAIQNNEKIPGLEFICDPAKELLNAGVLRELGRFRDERDIREIALAVCDAERQEHRSIRAWERSIRWARFTLFSETVSDNGDGEHE